MLFSCLVYQPHQCHALFKLLHVPIFANRKNISTMEYIVWVNLDLVLLFILHVTTPLKPMDNKRCKKCCVFKLKKSMQFLKV